jgi:hypothetical protein
VWIAIALAAGAGIVIAAWMPTRGRVALELLDKLGVTRSAAFSARLPPEASTRFVAGSMAAAVCLPLLLVAMRRVRLGLELQEMVFVAYALGVPVALRRRSTPRRASRLASRRSARRWRSPPASRSPRRS